MRPASQTHPAVSGTFRFGRLPRVHDPRVPHMSAQLAGKTLPAPPPTVDWTHGMPKILSPLLNDRINNCTCAAFYHAVQVWSFNAAGKMAAPTDEDAEQLYIQTCGYNPRARGEGPGGHEQHVLNYLLHHGAPRGPHGTMRRKIFAFLEIDPRNIEDVKRTIHDCGVAYVGLNLPQSAEPAGKLPPPIWQYVPDQSKTIEGHAVVLTGYDQHGARFISWGRYYTMTWEFFAHFVDEVYAIADPEWMARKGRTPGGLTLPQLEFQMKALKEHPPARVKKS